jgi:hypothetical protein
LRDGGRKDGLRRGGVILRAWGAAVLRPYNVLRMDRGFVEGGRRKGLRRGGLILRAWGAAVLRPYNCSEIARCCLEAGVGDVVDDYIEVGAECSCGDQFGDWSRAD